MKITLFTANQARHNYLINLLSSVSTEINVSYDWSPDNYTEEITWKVNCMDKNGKINILNSLAHGRKRTVRRSRRRSETRVEDQGAVFSFSKKNAKN